MSDAAAATGAFRLLYSGRPQLSTILGSRYFNRYAYAPQRDGDKAGRVEGIATHLDDTRLSYTADSDGRCVCDALNSLKTKSPPDNNNATWAYVDVNR